MEQNNPKNVFSRLGFAQVAGIAATIIVSKFFLVPLARPENLQKIADTAGLSMILFMIYIPQIVYLLVFWLIVRPMPKSEWQKESMDFKTLLKIFIMMYSVSSIINSIGLQITKIAPANGESQTDLIMKMQSTKLLMGILIPVLIGPVLEELIFRKLMLDRIRNFGEKTAIIFSALCFGLFHGNLTQFLFATCVGLFLGYVYCKTGNVLITIVMHMLLNGSSTIIVLAMPLLEDPNTDKVVLTMLGLGFVLLVMGIMTVLGIILLIRWIKQKSFRLDDTMPTCIAPNEVLKTVYLNPGVILLFAFTIFEIAAGLFNLDIRVNF